MASQIEMQGAVKLKELMRLYIPRALETRELLKVAPLVKDDAATLVYERRGVNTGLQGARGLGGRTNRVNKPGVDQNKVEPGYYGDHWLITEAELVNLRAAGDWQGFDPTGSQTARGAEHLTQRFLDRCEYSIAQTLMTGGFTAADAAGVVKHRDAFNVPRYTPNVLFSDLDNSQPLNYIRDLIPTLELGKAVNFRKGAMWMSRPTVNLILKNQNAADLNGKRLQYGQTVNSIDELNELLVSNDLPKVMVYDAGYYSDPPGSSPTFNRFLTNGKIVLVGSRTDGEQIGEYRLTRAAQNGDNAPPGEWYQVEDRRDKDPCLMILRSGHNGGFVPLYPEGLATINAAVAF